MSLIDKIKGRGMAKAMGVAMDFITPDMIESGIAQITAGIQAQEAASGKHFVAVMELKPDGRPAINLYTRDESNHMHFEQAVNVPGLITQILNGIKNGTAATLSAVA